MICFVALSLGACQTTAEVKVDGYCTLYRQIIVNKGDSRIAGNPEVKKRIAANEVTFRRFCK